ncbi:type II toxin-antitoxin system HicB family antitoxin [Candidatus Parcubacteria bacterium]|nr:type II toxin-antitoxin system HicB family antitoxin [Candidatus Parcubacteria bacterium]
MTRTTRTKILHYYAVFEPAQEGGYNVSFPSFPGCVTFGRNFEQAQRMAQEVLELWLEEFRESNETIPTYSRHLIVDEIPVKVPAKR